MSGTTDRGFVRRSFLAGAGVLATAGFGTKTWLDRNERGLRSDVFVGRASSYEGDLEGLIRDGLSALGVGRRQVAGKSVLLKPNLVEPSREAPQINTHPAMVLGAAEVFRRWDAREVRVGEGQGHCRDSDYVLEQSGLGKALAEAKLEFVDLNHDELWTVTNPSRFTRLARLTLPQALRRADLVVSMPKMKTHHWAGLTGSMKNLFGVLPGLVYGWPKNVLHHEGIDASILDINAAVRPGLAIVDGIVAMEGDGPIMGTPRHAGLVVVGTNTTAVDATLARLMTINPRRLPYLASASGRLGPILERHIPQRGESLGPLVQRFQLLDHPAFDALRT